MSNAASWFDRLKPVALTMSESPPNKNNRLDLGLSDLLSSVVEKPEAVAPAPEVSGSAPAREAGAISSSNGSPYAQLKDSGRWQEIIAIAERSLTGERGAESSLWWVRGHLGALSMPVSLLVAPFERVARELATAPVDAECRQLLEETAGIMLDRLQQVGEREQVLSFQALLRDLQVAAISGELGKHRHTWTLAAESSTLAVAIPPLPGQVPQVSRRRAPRLAIVLVLLLFFVGASLALWEIRESLFSTPTALAFEGFVRDPSLPEQEQAAVLPRDPVGDLSALFYSIEPPTPAASGDSAGASSNAQSGQRAGDTAAAPDVQPGNAVSASKPKERVDTSGPLEGPEYRSGVDRGAGGASRQSPSAGGSDRRQPPGPFDRQVQGKVYRIVARVNVVASPSYRGNVIGRLQPGDEVLVDGRVGAWLKLRSRRGNEGYILAQDAEVVEGKSADDLR